MEGILAGLKRPRGFDTHMSPSLAQAASPETSSMMKQIQALVAPMPTSPVELTRLRLVCDCEADHLGGTSHSTRLGLFGLRVSAPSAPDLRDIEIDGIPTHAVLGYPVCFTVSPRAGWRPSVDVELLFVRCIMTHLRISASRGGTPVACVLRPHGCGPSVRVLFGPAPRPCPSDDALTIHGVTIAGSPVLLPAPLPAVVMAGANLSRPFPVNRRGRGGIPAPAVRRTGGPVWEAAVTDDEEKLLAALGRGLTPNDEAGDVTAVAAAASMGHAGIVRILVDAGAYLNSQDTEYRTPLHLAAENCHAAVVRALLASPTIDVNARDACSSQTPLMAAARHKCIAVVRVLLADSRVDVMAVHGGGEYSTAADLALRPTLGRLGQRIERDAVVGRAIAALVEADPRFRRDQFSYPGSPGMRVPQAGEIHSPGMHLLRAAAGGIPGLSALTVVDESLHGGNARP